MYRNAAIDAALRSRDEMHRFTNRLVQLDETLEDMST